MRNIFMAAIIAGVLSATMYAADQPREAVEAVLHARPFGQQGAMAECKKIGKPVVPVLINALKDPKTDWAAKGRIGATLEEVLRDEKNRDEKFLNDLEPLSQQKDSKTADEAVRAVAKFKGIRRAREIIRGVIKNHPNEFTRGVAIGDLMVNSNRDKGEIPFLKQRLADKSPFVRARAAGAMGRLGDKSGYETAIAALKEDHGKRSGIDALGDIGDPRAIPILQPFYDDPKDPHGVAALLAIKEIEFKQLDSIERQLGYLKETLYFGQSPAQWAAQKLIDMNDPRALDILKKTASDKSNPGRDASRQHLQSRGITKEEWWH